MREEERIREKEFLPKWEGGDEMKQKDERKEEIGEGRERGVMEKPRKEWRVLRDGKLQRIKWRRMKGRQEKSLSLNKNRNKMRTKEKASLITPQGSLQDPAES